MKNHPRRRLLMAAALTIACAAGLAQAQASSADAPAAISMGNWPQKPIKWIVGYAAGGGTDFLARTVGQALARELGQAVLIDNRPGAGAIIATEAGARAMGDGYTLLSVDNGALIYNPVMYKKIPYNPDTEFANIGLLARFPLLVAVPQNSPYHDMGALLAAAKASTSQLAYATPGNGGPHHLTMELLKERASLTLLHIPYRGAAPAIQDVLAGQVPIIMVDTAAGMAHLKAGTLRALMVMSAQRLAQLPNVPTAIEMGYAGLVSYAWQGLVVPASTPEHIQQRLSIALQKTINQADVGQKLRDFGLEPTPSTAAQMSALVAQEKPIWQKLIHDKKIYVDK